MGKFSCEAEGRDEPAFVDDCAVSLRVVRGAEAVPGGIGWPGWVTSDEVASVVPTIVGSLVPFRVT